MSHYCRPPNPNHLPTPVYSVYWNLAMICTKKTGQEEGARKGGGGQTEAIKLIMTNVTVYEQIIKNGALLPIEVSPIYDIHGTMVHGTNQRKN